MKTLNYSFNIQPNSISINVCAQHMAFLAHGLLGEVDTHWTQAIDGNGVTMRFQKPEHIAQFVSRWHSLTQADWYQPLRHGNDSENQILSSSSSEHECEVVLTGGLYRREIQRIENDYKEVGIPHAELGDYAEAAEVGLLNKMVRLASHLDIDGFEVESLDDCEYRDEESDPLNLRVRLKFTNRSNLSFFLRHVQRLGWCA
ncbi:hypothetical protein [Microvirga sp. 17 mud 1-3]|uniref:hypothetical protein n=1 Tax=Microvirga sp. 17 mud 1-3 TaxID=2082949 RepID=UPI000D6ADC86|nr:hypothetical protein [Microvirga sp. 17 mud 1-3]AWM86791.1 hypothetical protein C4E04_08690 [Microvirga sp. 17 mud 1-3]